jgi:hypothetical protein
MEHDGTHGWTLYAAYPNCRRTKGFSERERKLQEMALRFGGTYSGSQTHRNEARSSLDRDHFARSTGATAAVLLLDVQCHHSFDEVVRDGPRKGKLQGAFWDLYGASSCSRAPSPVGAG